jgi:regulator of sigma E protease
MGFIQIFKFSYLILKRILIMIINILIVIFAISFVVFIHELGHFFVAKFFGVNVEKFSVGFGKEIFGWTKNNTRYCFAMIPLGGFVKMQGESIFEEQEIKAGDFLSIVYWKRILVVFAGPLMNILFTFLVIFFISVFCGVFSPKTNDLTIGEVLKNSAAETVGMLAGDKLVSVNNTKILSWENLFEVLKKLDGKQVEVVIERATKNKNFVFLPKYEKETKRFVLGIAPKIEQKKVGILEGVGISFNYIVSMGKGFIGMFQHIFSHQKNKLDFMGPLGIVGELNTALEQGFSQFLFLLALVSLNLGFLNLLPLPILDGGHIFIFGIEWISGKKINRKFLEFVYIGMMILLLALMVFVTNKDIFRFLGK